jgi:hypothetical protein
MRSWLFGLFILAASVSNCHKDNGIQIDQIDLLYRTWQLTAFTRNDGRPITITPHSSYIQTFRQNGTILYGADGTYPICCNPIRFNRKGSVLDLSDVTSIPIPADVPRADCSLVDCVPPDTFWQIMTLTPQELIIKNDRGTAIYKAYP